MNEGCEKRLSQGQLTKLEMYTFGGKIERWNYSNIERARSPSPGALCSCQLRGKNSNTWGYYSFHIQIFYVKVTVIQ